MGYWTMVGAGGPVVGVVAGGPIVETFGWRWIFVAQAPLAVAGLLMALVVLPETTRRKAEFDVAGAVVLAVGATSLLVAINRGPSWGWSSPAIVAGFALAPIAVVAFLVIERRVPSPLLPLAYLRRRNFTFAIATQCCTNFAYMGGFVITPLFLGSVFDYPETRVGGLMIARPLAFAIAGPLAGYAAVRVGERTSAVTGAVFVVASMVALSSVAPGSSDLVIIGALALSGIGLGCSSPSLAASIANAVDERDLGVAGAFQQMMTQLGVVLGIQLMQTVAVVREDAVGEVAAYGEAYLLAAAGGHGGRRAGLVRAVDQTRRRGLERPPRRRQRWGSGRYSVISWIFAAISAWTGSGVPCCMAMSLVMSPCTLILPAMKACIPACGLPVHEDRLGRGVVERDGEVGVLEVARVHLELATGGVHVGVDGAVAERDLGDDLVHPDGVGRRRRLALVLLADLLGRLEPFVGQELVRHVGYLRVGQWADGTVPRSQSACR